jgi:multicomponent Na+:H+ antiporter subunit G
MNDLIAAVLILAGASLMLVAAIGVLRLPDVLCRSHAVAKALTLGIFLLLLGMWVFHGDNQAAFKILLAILFQVITIPVASHLVGLLSYQKNLPRWRHRPIDDHRAAQGNSSDPLNLLAEPMPHPTGAAADASTTTRLIPPPATPPSPAPGSPPTR